MPGPWSSHKAGTPRGRPSQGTAGSIPTTGGHQPKDWQALFFNKKRLNDLTKLLEADVSEVVYGVPSWFGGLVFLRLFLYSWFRPLLLLRFGLVIRPFFGSFPSRSRLTATREVVQLPQELFSITTLQGSALPLLARIPCLLVREFGGNLQRHLARVQKVVFSLSCTSLSFLGFPMEGCILIGGRLSDGSLRRWRPNSVRFPFWRDRLVSSHRYVADLCP